MHPPRADRPLDAPRRHQRSLPGDGEDGRYYQSWYPLALSSEVGIGEVVGREFLGGRVAVFRTMDGKAAVVSAFCPHLGADLSIGKVVGEHLRCAFHHWEFNGVGRCVKTGIGDPPPKTARLFRFPVAERFGIIWAFNGTEPLFDLPEFEKPDESLVTRAVAGDLYHCDGWVFACNTPDMQHIKVVHGIRFKHDDPHEGVTWSPWGFHYRIEASHGLGPAIDWKIGITGTSIFSQEGTIDGYWLGAHVAFSCPGPNRHRAFISVSVERGDGSEATLQRAEARLQAGAKLISETAEQDRDILNTIHFSQGTLTRSDRTLSQFLDRLREFPRAHPAAEFIR